MLSQTAVQQTAFASRPEPSVLWLSYPLASTADANVVEGSRGDWDSWSSRLHLSCADGRFPVFGRRAGSLTMDLERAAG